jgi:hypothetical protein
MVVRQFRKHVADHNWFAAVIDFLIVLIGVFLGIEASNWNQARLDRRQAREYRAMLVSDLDRNIANLETRHRYYNWVKSEALATLAALDQPADELGEQFLIDAYQASQIQPWVLKRTTYDQILSVGAMSELGSPLLRDRIANYYVAADIAGFNVSALPAYREILRRIMPYRVQERIRSRCNEKVVSTPTGAGDIILPGRCTLGLDTATLRVGVRSIHNWPALDLDINRWLVDLDQKLLSVDALHGRALAIKADLMREDGKVPPGKP